MQQVQLASVPILGANGVMVPDQQCRPGNLSHTKRSWRSWWARKHVLFRSDNEAAHVDNALGGFLILIFAAC